MAPRNCRFLSLVVVELVLSFFCYVSLVAHDCGYPLSRYTCRATRVAADFLDFIAFCRCSTGVALHPLKILVSHLPPPCPGRCRTEIWVWKGVALHGGVAATVAGVALHCATKYVSLAMLAHSGWRGWPGSVPCFRSREACLFSSLRKAPFLALTQPFVLAGVLSKMQDPNSCN